MLLTCPTIRFPFLAATGTKERTFWKELVLYKITGIKKGREILEIVHERKP